MDIIDVHSHVVPAAFPADPGTEARWPCLRMGDSDHAVVMIAGKPFRDIDNRSWDVARRIEDMDRCGVQRQALSPMPELLSYWFEPAHGLEMCRHNNAVLAEMVARAPRRFSALGIVPMQDPDLAATELARLAADGFSGIEIGSNINGAVLGADHFDPVWSEAERLGLAVFVHALHPVGADRLAATPDLVPFAAFPLDTALAAASLIRAGVPERHPGLRLGFSHGGGAIVPVAHRLGQGAKITNGFGGRLEQSPAEYASRFFYDNLVYDPGYAAYLANHFAPGHVFCGTDYPYAIMETAPEAFIRRTALADPESVRFRAAMRFLGL